jgi:membrane protein YdbS with pleckstrin-like domain
MYARIRDRVLWLLQAPQGPPDPPAGSESSVRVFRAAPAFLTLQIIPWAVGFAAAIFFELWFDIFGFIAKYWSPAASFTYILLAVTVAGLVVKYFLIRVDFDMRYYVVTDRSLRIREGALRIDESTFTFANVQNLRIQQGPLERMLGLANVIVETAGGSGGSGEDGEGGQRHHGVLRGITNASEVRDQILRLLRQYRDAGLGDPEDRGGVPGGEVASAVAIDRLREIRDELRLARQAVRVTG